MRFIKHFTTWLLLLTVFMVSGVVSAKVASGVQNLSVGLHQENVAANALLHLAKIDFSYDAASGFPLVTKRGTSVGYLIKSSTPGRSTKGRSSLFDRKGGPGQANKDFDALNPSGIKDIPGGRVGKLDDGRTAIVRNKSSDGRPTLEIQQGKNKTKFRFDD